MAAGFCLVLRGHSRCSRCRECDRLFGDGFVVGGGVGSFSAGVWSRGGFGVAWWSGVSVCVCVEEGSHMSVGKSSGGVVIFNYNLVRVFHLHDCVGSREPWL